MHAGVWFGGSAGFELSGRWDLGALRLGIWRFGCFGGPRVEVRV